MHLTHIKYMRKNLTKIKIALRYHAIKKVYVKGKRGHALMGQTYISSFNKKKNLGVPCVFFIRRGQYLLLYFFFKKKLDNRLPTNLF